MITDQTTKQECKAPHHIGSRLTTVSKFASGHPWCRTCRTSKILKSRHKERTKTLTATLETIPDWEEYGADFETILRSPNIKDRNKLLRDLKLHCYLQSPDSPVPDWYPEPVATIPWRVVMRDASGCNWFIVDTKYAHEMCKYLIVDNVSVALFGQGTKSVENYQDIAKRRGLHSVLFVP